MGLLDILSPISWIAEGVGDVFNDLLGGNGARKDQQKYNLQNMEIQQQYAQQNMATMNRYNIDAFNRENAWNAPTAQQQRNYAAGINPMWQDGSGAVVAQQDSGVSATAPSGSMPSAGSSASLGDIVALATASSEVRNLKASTDEKEALARLHDEEANRLKLRTPVENRESEANITKSLTDAGFTQKQIDYFEQDFQAKIDNLEWQNKSLEARIKEINTLLPANFAKLDAEKQAALAKALLDRVVATYHPAEVSAKVETAHAATTSAGADVMNAKTNQQNAQTNSFRAITERIQTNENIRHDKKLENLQQALNNSIVTLNNSQSKYYDSSSGKIDSEKYYQDLYNTVYEDLVKAGIPYEMQNSIMWKIKAEKELIHREIEQKGLEIEYFNDSYFGRLYKDYLPVPLLSR